MARSVPYSGGARFVEHLAEWQRSSCAGSAIRFCSSSSPHRSPMCWRLLSSTRGRATKDAILLRRRRSSTPSSMTLNMNDKTPLVDRFARWAGGVVRGDLGRTVDNTSVNEEIGRRMWVSLRLVLLGAFVGTSLGVAAGAFSAVKQYRPVDHLVTVFSFVVLSTPVVVLAVLLQERRHRAERRARLHRRHQTAVHDRRNHSGAGVLVVGRARRPGRSSCAAVARPHHHGRRVLRPLSAQRHARRARQRLPAHRAGQGAAALARAHQARAAHRAHPDGDVLRLPVRAALRRRHVHREASSAGTAWANTSSTRSPRTTSTRWPPSRSSWPCSCSSPDSCPIVAYAAARSARAHVTSMPTFRNRDTPRRRSSSRRPSSNPRPSTKPRRGGRSCGAVCSARRARSSASSWSCSCSRSPT